MSISRRRRRSRGRRVRGESRALRAHEFHYAALENVGPDVRYAYAVKRGYGIDGERDGIVVGNVLASFAHRRSTRSSDWAARFVEFIRRSDYRQRREGNIVYLDAMRSREALIV